MENPVINEDVIRKYLLDELSDQEREQIEQSLLVDDEFFNNLTTLEDVIEDELIDQYVSGELNERESVQLERLTLSSPERREKLNLARDLNEYALVAAADAKSTAKSDAPARDGSTRWWHALLAFRNWPKPMVGISVAVLIAAVAFTWLFFRTRQLESELERLRAGQQQSPPTQAPNMAEQLEQLRARNDELAANLRDSEARRARAEQEAAAALASAERRGRETSDNTGRTNGDVASARTRSSVLPLALSMISGRSSEEEPVKVLNLSPDVGRVQLHLNLENIDPTEYEGFRAELKKRRDETPVRSVNFRAGARQKQLVMTVSATLLTEGEYVVELNGLFNRGQSEPVGTYLFRVSPQK